MKTAEEFLGEQKDGELKIHITNKRIYISEDDVLRLMEAYASQPQWMSVDERLPKGDLESKANEITVIGYSEKWIHPDFNPLGQRMCGFCEVFGWHSSRWNGTHDCYIDVQPDEDDNPTHWTPLQTPPTI